MSPSEPDPEALVALAGILVAEQSLEKTLTQVVELACGAIDGADLAGITLLECEGPYTAAASTEEARRVDASQYEIGAGPCLSAYREQVTNHIDSTPRRPALAPVLRAGRRGRNLVDAVPAAGGGR